MRRQVAALHTKKKLRGGCAGAEKTMRRQVAALLGKKKKKLRGGCAAAEGKTRCQVTAVHMKQPRDGCAAAGKTMRCQVTALHKRKKKTRRFEGALARRALAGSVGSNMTGKPHRVNSPIIARMRSVTTFRSASITARSRGGLNT